MTFKLYASKIQSEVLAERDSLRREYRNHPDATLHFCMIDLVRSSSYRSTMGPEAGYIRGESFFTLVRSAIRPYTNIRLFKEIGDAALLSCSEFRPLLEAGMLMCQASLQLALVAGDDAFPFSIRLAIDFGIAKQLKRRNEDYLGECIDRLARIMAVRSESSNFLLSEDTYNINKAIVQEYSPLYSVSDPFQLRLGDDMRLSSQVIYREMIRQAEPIPEFDDYFIPWHRQTKGTP